MDLMQMLSLPAVKCKTCAPQFLPPLGIIHLAWFESRMPGGVLRASHQNPSGTIQKLSFQEPPGGMLCNSL